MNDTVRYVFPFQLAHVSEINPPAIINKLKEKERTKFAAVPASKITSLSSGEFVGMVADNPDEKIALKAFARFRITMKRLKEKSRTIKIYR